MSDISKKLEYENINLASINKRVIAMLVDELILGFLFAIIYYDYFATLKTYKAIVAAVSALAMQYIAIRTIYHTFFVWYYGATPAKMMVKIACIDVGYLDKPSLGASFIRAVIRNISESAFYLGFLWAFSNQERQTWHDKLAKTVVIDVS